MIHPRRMAGLFLAALLCLAGARAAALADGRERETVTEADALRIASEAVRQAVSLSDDEFASLTPAARRAALDGHSGDVWEVSFLLTSGSYAIGVYELTVEPYTGGILLAAIPEDAYENALREAEGYKVLEEWRQTKGDSYFWTMEDEVWLQQTYFDGLYRMPGDGDLSEEEAITLAQKYAADELKLTREYLDSLHPCAPVRGYGSGEGNLDRLPGGPGAFQRGRLSSAAYHRAAQPRRRAGQRRSRQSRGQRLTAFPPFC